MTCVQGPEAGHEIQKQIAVDVLDHRSLRALDNDGFRTHPEAEGGTAFRLPEAIKLLSGFGAGVGDHEFRRVQGKSSSIFGHISAMQRKT